MTRAARSVPRAVRDTSGELRRASLLLTAQLTALVLVLLAVLGGIVYVIVGASISESENRALTAAAQIDSSKDAASGTYVTLVDAHTGGQVVTPADLPAGLLDMDAIRAVLAGGADQRSERTVDGRSYLLLTTSTTGDAHDDRVVQVALDQHESREELARLTTALLVGGAVAAILAFLAAYLMARRAIRPLSDALALQRRFVADASHELRTPLTLLSTRAQLLRRRNRADLPLDVAESIDDLVTDARALTEILDDLLIAADPRSEAAQSPVDLVAVVDQAVALLADRAVARRVVLARDGSTSSVTVQGTPAALLRLVIALSTNALDHARSTVTISVAAAGPVAMLTVADDGPGFSPDMAAAAFDRFASDRTRAPDHEGDPRHYGLGLAIVSEIARRHHGAVTIDQTAVGGVVTCTLPLASAPG